MARTTATGESREVRSKAHKALSLKHQRGLVLLTALLFVFLTTLAAGSMVQMYQTQTQREKEEELMFVGDQYRRAIASYYNTMPAGSARTLPTSLEALLNDQRFPTPIQHLRRLYPDPMTGSLEWGVIQEAGGITGVYSLSDQPVLKTSRFLPLYKEFEGKSIYTEWRFQLKRN